MREPRASTAVFSLDLLRASDMPPALSVSSKSAETRAFVPRRSVSRTSTSHDDVLLPLMYIRVKPPVRALHSLLARTTMAIMQLSNGGAHPFLSFLLSLSLAPSPWTLHTKGSLVTLLSRYQHQGYFNGCCSPFLFTSYRSRVCLLLNGSSSAPSIRHLIS